MLRNEEAIDIKLEQEISEDELDTVEAQAERDYDTARRYVHIAEHMKQYEDIDKYYRKAQGYFKKAHPYVKEADFEKDVSRKKFNARALGRIELYEQAMDIKKKAKTSEDFYAARCLFERIVKASEKLTVPEGKVSEELFEKLKIVNDAENQMKECDRLMDESVKKIKLQRAVISISVILVIAGFLMFTRTLAFRRCLAVFSSMIGDSAAAANAYDYVYKATGEKEAKENYNIELYKAAVDACEAGEYKEALPWLYKLAVIKYEDSSERLIDVERKLISQAADAADEEKGSELVTVGNMKWRILDVKKDRVLLLKNEGISDKTYNKTAQTCTWDVSDGRKWLNSEFLTLNFATSEVENMVNTTVVTNDNEDFGTNGGKETVDKVFLLSSDEAEKYQTKMVGTEACWWLRSPGANPGSMAFVYMDKTVMSYGFDASKAKFNFKPAMWYKLK